MKDRIGVSLPPDALLDEPGTAGAVALQGDYGSPRALLAALREQGARSVELRAVQRPEQVALAKECVKRIWDAGLQASIHGTLALEGLEEALSPLLGQIAREQGQACVTLHSMKTQEETRQRLQAWSALGEEGVCIALENQRVHSPDKAHCILTGVGEAIAGLPANIGLCWDMGHYIYNRDLGYVGNAHMAPEILGSVIHTHIHGVVEGTTHFPADQSPEQITGFVRALQGVGYQGVYNLELEGKRFATLMSFRQGIETSLTFMKELLGP